LLARTVQLPATQRRRHRHGQQRSQGHHPHARLAPARAFAPRRRAHGRAPAAACPGTARAGTIGSIIRPMKYLVIVAFAGIIGSLGAALVFMMRGGSAQPDPQEGDSSAPPRPNGRMARALAWRVGLSVLLFVIV